MPHPENYNWIAIEPGLASLLRQERDEPDSLPLAIRRFVDRQEAAGVVEAARRVTDRVLDDYRKAVGQTDTPVRLSKIAELQSVALRGLNNVGPKHGRAHIRRQRYRAAITMGGQNAIITIPPGSDRPGARISVAHELGHLFIHSRGITVDEVTVKLGTSNQEEALAEYIGRLLLLPKAIGSSEVLDGRTARLCFDLATSADVPLLTALMRIGDPDLALGIAGVILWELRPDPRLSITERLKPYSRFCGSAFIPDRSHAREGSLTASVGEGEDERFAIGNEAVEIGSFVGTFRVEAYGWGSQERGTRKVLTIFGSSRNGTTPLAGQGQEGSG